MKVSKPPIHARFTLDSTFSIPSSLHRENKPTRPDRLLSKTSRLQTSSDCFDMETSMKYILAEQYGVLKAGNALNIA